MANTIIGREQELALLDKIMASDRAEFLAVYGRISVGKTYLISEYLKPHIVFSFSGSFEEPTKQQLYYSLFKNAANHTAVIESLASHPYGLVRNQLVKKSKISDGGTFTRTINDLVESGFIVKYQPFQKKEKDSIYRLIDMYSLFYLRFIKGINTRQTNSWQLLSKEAKFIAWSGYAYENICLLHTPQILKKLGLAGTITQVSSWYHKGNKEIPGAQIDLLIDRKDGVVNLCEAKFFNQEFLLTKEYVAQLRRKRAIFEQVTTTKKSVVTTLITTYPAIQNTYYLEEVHSEVGMEDLFDRI